MFLAGEIHFVQLCSRKRLSINNCIQGIYLFLFCKICDIGISVQEIIWFIEAIWIVEIVENTVAPKLQIVRLWLFIPCCRVYYYYNITKMSSSFLDTCEKYFGERDLYKVLRISKDATEKEVRKAYHKLSLFVHPDRVEENQKLEATEKFKILGKVHSILSDTEKRAIYDETGDYDEESEGSIKDWCDYWRSLFKEITIEDINKYEKQYKGSEEERLDLKKAYVNGKGDMDFILNTVPFTNTDEEPRICSIIQEMIDKEEVSTFRAFTHESAKKKEKRKRKWAKEAEEAKKIQEELYGGENGDLKAMIQKRQSARAANRDSFLDSLLEKYNDKESSTKKKKTSTKKTPSKKK